MFPHARNSLRHDKGKIPIPIAVGLHNIMVGTRSDKDDNENDDAQTWFRRTKYEVNLLPQLRLKFLVEDDIIEENGVHSTSETTGRVLYASPAPIWGVQVTWEHLEEKIDAPGEWWRGGMYKTMTLQIEQIVRADENNSSTIQHTTFLEAPLHPSKLERLESIPTALPPNTLFIYFSDGSTRCTSSIFQVLHEQKLVEILPLEDFSRFEDDAFSALDGVQATPNRRRTGSVSALLEPQDLNSRLIDEFDGPENDEMATEVSFEENEQESIEADMVAERKRLLQLIAEEDRLLKEETRCLEKEREHLSCIAAEATEIDTQTQHIRDEIARQIPEFRKENFRKEAQHMKLVRELRTIYPILLDSQKGFLIRGLRLPVDILTTAVPEDEISAALGFCCHLVFMLAKYLSISMRYRIFCNSSRSAIQSNGTSFLPLFLARSVEREHLEQGMWLLGENIDCMLITLGIEFTPGSHILGKLKRVYDHITEGEIALNDNGFR